MTNATGADYSHFQSFPDLAANDFVFLKATQGNTYKDPTFPTRWTQVLDLGKVRGAYHFMEGAGGTGTVQADFYLNYVKPGAGDLCVMDWEWHTQAGSFDATPGQAEDFVKRIEEKTGRKPVVYTGRAFAEKRKVPAAIAACDLWVWDVAGTLLPSAWDHWTFKQNHSGQPNGNEFAGDIDALKAYAGGEDMTDAEVRAIVLDVLGLNTEEKAKDLQDVASGVAGAVDNDAPTNTRRKQVFDFVNSLKNVDVPPAPHTHTVTGVAG